MIKSAGKLSGIRAVSFDAYGTLIGIERPFHALRSSLERRGFSLPLETVKGAFMEEMFYYRANHMQGRDEKSLQDLRLRCSQVLFEGFLRRGFAFSFAPSEYVEILMESIRFFVFDDVFPCLALLNSLGIKTAVISNWDFDLPRVLGALLPSHNFDAVVVSAIEGVDKTSPEIYGRAAERLALSPSRILHVGDDLFNDLVSAQRAGFRAVLLDREGKAPAEGPALSSLRSLNKLF